MCERLSGVASVQLTKRLTFSAFDLASRLPPKFGIIHLAEYVFEDQGFKPVDDALADVDELLMNGVLQNRSGSPLAIGIWLRALAAKAGLDASFIQFPDLSILKCRAGEERIFLDLRQRGKVLNRGEMLELLQKNQPKSDNISFEPLQEEAVVARYLKRLGLEYQDRGDDLRALVVYDALIELQPKSLSVLKDRSMAYYRLGRKNEALQDLKRFFSFSAPDQQPPELLQIYSALQRETGHPPA
ncbi:MAG TPA: tetratricopeptide repeat protein [Bdellovibrionales bacterium]|nr:tetratricopeptide repeat protein [Bdellovibrionales bacterium]